MKIGIFDPYLDDLGGGEKYMMKIAQCLLQDHSIDVFWDNREDVKDLSDRFLIDLSGINLVKNIFSPKISILNRLWETKKYDVIIILSDGSIPFSLSKKTFIHFQQPIQKLRLTFKNRIKIKRINNFFCNSKYTKSYIDKSLGIKSLVIYPPIELKPKKLKKQNVILNVGRFRVRDVVTRVQDVKVGIGDYKKQGIMIEAFRKMMAKGLKGWKLVIATSIKEQDHQTFQIFKKAAEGLPVEFLVNKTNDELWDTYSIAKIYWHASGFGENLKEHPEYAEHFGISTVEAMGAGAVAIVIDAGGQKEIVEDGKSGFLWNTLSELIDKTSLLIKSEKMLAEMSEKATRRAQLLADNKFCKEISKLINS